MFTKYVGKFGKVEIEWCVELLDYTDGDIEEAKSLLGEVLKNIRDKNKSIEKNTPPKWMFWKKTPEINLSAFEQDLRAMFFANGSWWTYLEEASEKWAYIHYRPSSRKMKELMKKTENVRAEAVRKYKEAHDDS